MTTPEEDAQTEALQTYFEDNTPAGYGASFRAGWTAGKQWTETPEVDRLNHLVITLSRELMRYQDAEAASEPQKVCQCGRATFIGRDGTARCPGCEYMAAETCDCVPAQAPDNA